MDQKPWKCYAKQRNRRPLIIYVTAHYSYIWFCCSNVNEIRTLWPGHQEASKSKTGNCSVIQQSLKLFRWNQILRGTVLCNSLTLTWVIEIRTDPPSASNRKITSCLVYIDLLSDWNSTVSAADRSFRHWRENDTSNSSIISTTLEITSSAVQWKHQRS